MSEHEIQSHATTVYSEHLEGPQALVSLVCAKIRLQTIHSSHATVDALTVNAVAAGADALLLRPVGNGVCHF